MQCLSGKNNYEKVYMKTKREVENIEFGVRNSCKENIILQMYFCDLKEKVF